MNTALLCAARSGLYRSGWRGETDGREEETMANIMDYLDWRGDLPLTVSAVQRGGRP